MAITAKFEGVETLLASLSALPNKTESGVKATDTLNAIKARVWDMGYVTRTINPGPKTMWSVNAWGEDKVLTIQAPTGFIRINRQDYLRILREEFDSARFGAHPFSQWDGLIKRMMENAAKRCADVVASHAPVDTGELREAIVPALPGDPALTGSGYPPYGVMDVDIEAFLEGL